MSLNDRDEQQPHKVWLSVGSNVAERQQEIFFAIHFLDGLLDHLEISPCYSTPALNGRDADYLNTVATGYYRGDRDGLQRVCKEYERARGRTPQSKACGEIVIDLDIVVWGDEVVREADFHRAYFTRGYQWLLKASSGTDR
ncbi:MAG: 2-amino-4-hydroxy-6-hydroxymethyldihydropteridine diphosphokinase [Bacteroidales bacterium]|nr:2-amino-4-hydroxy-6-hydroxymethyldihydropteridine diphosphokinase [Bacteroidales bacterium]